MKKKDQDLLKLGVGALVLLWIAGVFAPYGYGSPLLAAGGQPQPGEAVPGAECTVPDDGLSYFSAATIKSIKTSADAETSQSATGTVCNRDGLVVATFGTTSALNTTTQTVNFGSTGYTMFLGPAAGTAAAATHEYHIAIPVDARCVKNPDGGKKYLLDVVGAATILARNQTDVSVTSGADGGLADGGTMTYTIKQTTDDAVFRADPSGNIGVCIHYPAGNISGWTVTNGAGQGGVALSPSDTAHGSASSTTTIGTTPTAKCWTVNVGGSIRDIGSTATVDVTPSFASGTNNNVTATVYFMDYGSIVVDCNLVEGWAYPAATGMTDFGIADASAIIDFKNAQ
jgi:hypothetical protein